MKAMTNETNQNNRTKIRVFNQRRIDDRNKLNDYVMFQ